MGLNPLFKLSEKHTPALIELLDSVVLGTNGAHYRHLDTAEKIAECDNIIHLSMERHEKVIGNISFCRRERHWYIRYFAFADNFQSGGKRKSNVRQSNFLKRELERFFSEVFAGEYGPSIDSFYAYIDPNNEKSLWMSESFGFETIGCVATQTFSRISPRKSRHVEQLESWEEVKAIVRGNYSNYAYYFETQTSRSPHYVIRDENSEIIAFAKVAKANWEIKRLPGKIGGLLTRIIPFIPGLRKIIRPKRHTFIVPEAVFVKDNDPKLLSELFEGILHAENKNLIIWWVDETDRLYMDCKSTVQWGMLHSLVGVNKANVVCKRNPSASQWKESPVFTAGIDFI